MAALGFALCAATLSTELVPSAMEPKSGPAAVVAAGQATRASAGSLRTLRGRPSASQTAAPVDERPTRLSIPVLDIDLPIILPARNETFPLCDVAGIETRYDPMAGGVTYLYAHARAGMFWDLLAASRRNDGRSLVGIEVLVWTDALRLHRYRITEVHRGQTTFALPDRSDDGTEERLWLQTSESATNHGSKLMVVAAPTSTEAASAADSLPKPRPRVCGS